MVEGAQRRNYEVVRRLVFADGVYVGFLRRDQRFVHRLQFSAVFEVNAGKPVDELLRRFIGNKMPRELGGKKSRG